MLLRCHKMMMWWFFFCFLNWEFSSWNQKNILLSFGTWLNICHQNGPKKSMFLKKWLGFGDLKLHWEDLKKCLDFGDIDLIFKFTRVIYLYEKVMSACYLLNQWPDLDQTGIDTSLGGPIEMIRFWWPWPNWSYNSMKKPLSAPPSELMARFRPNWHRYIIERTLRNDLNLVTLT